MKLFINSVATFIFIAVAFLVPNSTFAAENFGSAIKPVTIEGKLKFGVQIVHDIDVGLFITSTFLGSEIAPTNLTSFAFRLYDVKIGNYVSPWMDYQRLNTPVVLPGYFAMQVGIKDKKSVNSVVGKFRNIILIIAVNQPALDPTPTHYLEFNGICNSYPQNFMDLTTGQLGCDSAK